MEDEFQISISIPTDDDGYILLRCEHCGEYFKVTADELNDDNLLNIYCPACGLISETYITEDVIKLAEAKVTNYAIDQIYSEFKKLERQTRNSIVKFKAGAKPRHEAENPIKSGIEALQIVEFPCCHRKAKIKPLLRMSSCCCPYCGVKNYDFE